MSDQIHQKGLLRLKHIIGDAKATPPIHALIPISKSAWWDGIKKGKFPPAIKIGRISVWKMEDIIKLIDELGEFHA